MLFKASGMKIKFLHIGKELSKTEKLQSKRKI